jgi:hypothetical protein
MRMRVAGLDKSCFLRCDATGGSRLVDQAQEGADVLGGTMYPTVVAGPGSAWRGRLAEAMVDKLRTDTDRGRLDQEQLPHMRSDLSQLVCGSH